MVEPSGDSESRSQAAALTFAMLRFEQEGAHAYPGHEPTGTGRMGVDQFLFLPSWKPIPRGDVVPFLANLPGPALLFPTATRGVASLMLVEELTGERRAWGQKTLDNQLTGINAMARQLGLHGDARVLLETSDELHVVSLDVVRLWAQRFGAPVGWRIGKLNHDGRASARLHLIASDGRGLGCDI